MPYPAGGATDNIARITADKIRAQLPGGIIVDNRTGASGRVGTEYVKNSDPDGSTLLFIPDYVMTVFPHLFSKLSYRPLQDFVPIATITTSDYVVVAGPGLPPSVNDIPGFLAWAKAHPQKAAFASGSAGTLQHFTGLMLGSASNTELLHVPYKGGALALQDVIGGQIPICISVMAEYLPHAKTGRVRALATTGAERSRYLPGVSTIMEAGFKDIVVQSWWGVFAPARTPDQVANRLAHYINEAIQTRETREGFSSLGMDVLQMSRKQFERKIREDLERWELIVKASGFKAEE